MKPVKQTLVDDQLVEKQLMAQMSAKQLCQEQHRKKRGGSFNPFNDMGLITKILKKTDHEYHGQEAKDATDAEITKLLKAGVWDAKPITRKEAARIHPDATFAKLFGILGIQDFEAASRKFKYRVLIQGSKMKDFNNNDVFFSDTSNAPPNMACIRTVVAYSHLTGSEAILADAEKAYTQPL